MYTGPYSQHYPLSVYICLFATVCVVESGSRTRGERGHFEVGLTQSYGRQICKDVRIECERQPI